MKFVDMQRVIADNIILLQKIPTILPRQSLKSLEKFQKPVVPQTHVHKIVPQIIASAMENAPEPRLIVGPMISDGPEIMRELWDA